MEAPAKIAEADFRFAGAEDTAEIISLVNNAFSVEKGDSALAFTTRDRVSKEEVDACLHGAGGEKRWLVLETPHPEENMAAACLICTGSTPGVGSVEVLAVEPTRQREGLGSHMLRRAEGILLNFRCRFVKMRVPQWREDVLGWAAKQGYKETGGGVWGELDGESAEDLTRPTRYFVLTRDLLKDKKVAGTFGDGTARFTAATAAAAERAAVANDSKPASNPASNAVPWRAGGECAKGREAEAEDESGRLAGFLSTVLRGLVDAEGQDQNVEESGEKGAENLAAAPMADMVVSTSGTTSSPEVLFPPLPPATSNKSRVSAGEARDLGSTGSTASAAATASSSLSLSNDELEVTEVQSVGRGDDETADGEEESVEDLLSSLMSTLNTEQGRADFRLLANGATS